VLRPHRCPPRVAQPAASSQHLKHFIIARARGNKVLCGDDGRDFSNGALGRLALAARLDAHLIPHPPPAISHSYARRPARNRRFDPDDLAALLSSSSACRPLCRRRRRRRRRCSSPPHLCTPETSPPAGELRSVRTCGLARDCSGQCSTPCCRGTSSHKASSPSPTSPCHGGQSSSSSLTVYAGNCAPSCATACPRPPPSPPCRPPSRPPTHYGRSSPTGGRFTTASISSWPSSASSRCASSSRPAPWSRHWWPRSCSSLSSSP
jgi:hypothetical protein